MYVILAQVVGAREANLRKELAILIALGREEAVETGGLGGMLSWSLPYRWPAPSFRYQYH
jgi:hypothetical protein